jgi:hypothetical protein
VGRGSGSRGGRRDFEGPGGGGRGGQGRGAGGREERGEGRSGGDRPGDVGEYRQKVDDRLDRIEERLERASQAARLGWVAQEEHEPVRTGVGIQFSVGRYVVAVLLASEDGRPSLLRNVGLQPPHLPPCPRRQNYLRRQVSTAQAP